MIKLKWNFRDNDGKLKVVPLYLKQDTILALESMIDGNVLIITTQIINSNHRAYSVADKMESIVKQMKD